MHHSNGNWFEQRVVESGCKEGASPAIAPFVKEGLPFQKPGEHTLFCNRQGRYVSEYTQNYVMNPEYVGPAQEADARCVCVYVYVCVRVVFIHKT